MNAIVTIAGGTFGEAIRRKILNVFLFIALASLVMGCFSASADPREELVLVRSFGLGIISIAGVFISVILGINLIPNEIERRTIYTVLSKPVQRYEFLLGKLFGGLLTVLANVALMGLFFFLLVSFKEGHPNISILKGVLMTYFELVLLTSIAVFFSSFLTPFINFFVTFGIYILGCISPMIEALGTPDPNHSDMVQVHFFQFLHMVLPNFDNFNIENPIIHPEQIVGNEATYIVTTIAYALLYSAIALTAAVMVFDRREL